jgi:predicted metalloprotease with PDZ domain
MCTPFPIRSFATASLCMLFLAVSSLECSSPTRNGPPLIKMRVDLSNAVQGIFHADLQIPCTEGTLSLHYPKWIPGEHCPNGPIMQLAGVQFSTSGKPVSWQRDPDDMYTFHCTIPENATILDASLDYLSPSSITGPGYGYSPNNTGRLFSLLWYSILLYPEAESTDNVMCEASLRFPAGWKIATSLPIRAQGNDTVAFDTVSLTRLVDSPVMGGENIRSISLSEEKAAPVTMDLIGDSPEAVEADSSQIMLCRNVVREVDALFGARHFQTYHFLISLSDLVVVDGIEHHESTDIRLPERAFLDAGIWKRRSYLIPNEYVHSWNGKFKRPLGLLATDFQQPVQTDLLWVYEGLTRYLDEVLTGRSGLRTPDEVHDYLAWAAGYLNQDRPGRTWRSLHDASVSAQLLYPASDEWTTWRRGWMDIYDEGALLWLEADATIREMSGGQHSLDDFCRQFYGGKAGLSGVETYTIDDVVKSLDKIAHFDWEKFFSERLNSHEPAAPMGGLSRAGWEVTYSDSPNSQVSLRENLEKRIDASWSIGLSVFDDGLVQDVVPGSPGFKTGIAPGMKVTKVNGEKWSIQALRKAMTRAKSPGNPIELVLQQGRRELKSRMEYHDGEGYPHLRRLEGKDDILERIIAPRGR